MHLTTQLAVTFLDTVLDKKEGVRFKRYLSPKWPMHHEDHIYSAESFAGWGDICPTDQNVGFADD